MYVIQSLTRLFKPHGYLSTPYEIGTHALKGQAREPKILNRVTTFHRIHLQLQEIIKKSLGW